jgi:hypothetical protein
MRRASNWLLAFAVVIGILSAAAEPGGAASGRVFGGAVQIQCWPLVLSVGDGLIKRAVVQWKTQCPGGTGFGYHGMLTGHPIDVERLVGPPQGKLGLYATRIDHGRFRAKLYGTIGLSADTAGTVLITIGGHLSGSTSRGFISGTIQQGGGRPNCYIGPLAGMHSPARLYTAALLPSTNRWWRSWPRCTSAGAPGLAVRAPSDMSSRTHWVACRSRVDASPPSATPISHSPTGATTASTTGSRRASVCRARREATRLAPS